MNNNFENQENVTVQQSKSKIQGKELWIVVVALAVIGLMIFIISSYKSGDNSINEVLPLKSSVDFQSIYNDCDLNSAYATVASDGSYLKISVKASDIKSYNVDDYKDVLKAHVKVNRELGIPESLDEKILQANALDGKQSEDFDNVKVTWSYNSSNGLMILYERK